jgi:uncharacterized protein DUF262/HNH endonuclease
MTRRLKTKLYQKPLSWFMELHKDEILNLNPGFQRKSVWSDNDRKKLIQSVLDGYPVPSVFLYKRQDDQGIDIYDVLDGKQRIESIFRFCRARKFSRQSFSVKYHFEDNRDWGDRVYPWEWKELCKYDYDSRILNYRMQVVEVSGDLDAIKDLFVRINSTGKKLTNQERRHASYVNSPVLTESEIIAKKLRKKMKQDRIISTVQILRMKDIELIAELIISFHLGGSINKKAAVDAAMSGSAYHLSSLRKAGREVQRAYKVAQQILPDIKTTRFRNVSEFYTLLMVIRHLSEDGRNLSNSSDQYKAAALLRRLSCEARRVQEERKKVRSGMKVSPVIRDYLMAVEQSADAASQRRKREQIVIDIIGPLFSHRDEHRRFTIQQRELIWAQRTNPKCPGTKTRKCNKVLTWDDFHADHIKPWSKGGPTDIANAQALCSTCNISKGNST